MLIYLKMDNYTASIDMSLVLVNYCYCPIILLIYLYFNPITVKYILGGRAMKKLGFLLLFTLFLFGCSEVEEILDDFINEITEESESGEGIEEQAKGEEVIEPDQEPLDIGNGGIFTHRGDNSSDDITVEVIVHGVDFLSEIEIETKLNDKKDFFVVDIEVRNSGENKITSSHYPNILLHNSSGQESNHPLYKEGLQK